METKEITVDAFLSLVFEKQPEELNLLLEDDIVIDWTSRAFWGVMSNCHHIEIFHKGHRLFYQGCGQDCLDDDDREKIFQSLGSALSKEAKEIASLIGTIG